MTRALPVRPGESILSAEAGVSVSCELDGTLSIADTGLMDLTLVRLTPSGRRFLAQQLLESAAHEAHTSPTNSSRSRPLVGLGRGRGFS